jgi:hypothetical protein
MRISIKIIVALGLLVASGANAADCRPKEILASYKNKDVGAARYLSGIGSGFMVANTNMENEGVAPLFCMPEQLPLTTAIIADSLDRYVSSGPPFHMDSCSSNIAFVVMNALEETFPCKSKR